MQLTSSEMQLKFQLQLQCEWKLLRQAYGYTSNFGLAMRMWNSISIRSLFNRKPAQEQHAVTSATHVMRWFGVETIAEYNDMSNGECPISEFSWKPNRSLVSVA